MARTLQWLVCITLMMTTAKTQRGYVYQRTYQGAIVYPTQTPYERPQPRNIQYDNQQISENLSTRSQEARKHRLEKLTQNTELENGTYKILNRLHLNKRGALEESITNPNDRVVFPGPTSKVSPSYEPQIPDDCRRKGFCENVPNYPTEFIEKLVNNLGDADKKKFQMDTLFEEEIQIAQRLGGTGTDQEIELCNFTEKIIYPESAPDKDNVWYTVINLKEKPLQGFRAEMCNTVNSNCNGIVTVQEGYKGGCKQKYVFRTMEALDNKGNQVQKSLKLPSCCSCVITVNNPFS